MPQETSLEDLLDHFEAEHIASALGSLDRRVSETKSEMIADLVTVAGDLRKQGRDPVSEVLRAFDAEELQRVGASLGVAPGRPDEAAERLAERVGFLTWAEKVFGSLDGPASASTPPAAEIRKPAAAEEPAAPDPPPAEIQEPATAIAEPTPLEAIPVATEEPVALESAPAEIQEPAAVAEEPAEAEEAPAEIQDEPILKEAARYIERLAEVGRSGGTQVVSNTKTERLLSKALSYVGARVDGAAPSRPERAVYDAWLRGGSRVAARLIGSSPDLKRPWGKGNERKATALVEVFALAMISRWYRLLDSRLDRPEEERQSARQVAAANILMIFDDYSDWAIKLAVADFMKLDTQFNYDFELNEGSMLTEDRAHQEENLLGLRALWACGVPVELDLVTPVFPLAGPEDRNAAGIPEWMTAPSSSMTMMSALANGTEECIRRFVAQWQAAEDGVPYLLPPRETTRAAAE